MDFVIAYQNYILAAWLGVIFFAEQMRQRFLVPTKISDGGVERWLKNGVFGILNRVLGPILMLPIMLWATSHSLWQRPDLTHGFLFFLIDLIVLDFTNYWFHRLSHSIPLLWRVHEVHHLDSAFDVTTGLRIHFAEIVLQNFFRAIPIIMLSIPLKSILLFEVILIFEGLFHHSNICIPKKLEKALSLIILTPEKHCVHHHALVKDTDSNYGFIFIWWDKLFSTFNQAKRKETWWIGLEYSPDLSCWGLLVSPFKLKDLKARMKAQGYKTVKNVS